ncbi:MAG: transposase [Deltaproteobacteria bacterium]|nr:transposase [Deltaproteobacteria bacterium]
MLFAHENANELSWLQSRSAITDAIGSGQVVPEDHLVYFIHDVVRHLDLSAIYESYGGSKWGHPAYHPEMMMVALLLYAYCVGVPSSRQIEKACKETIESTPTGS